MKKLMIALAAIAIAAVSQAATVSWSVGDIYKGDTLLSGGVAYVFNNKGTYSSAAALATAMAGATTVDAVNAILANADPVLGGAVTSGVASNSGVTFSTTDIPGKTSGVKTFAVIFDTSTVTADSNWYVTTESNSVKTVDPAGTATSTFSIASQASATQGKANAWTAVPEPTSGLLLLLGMAGLALKRKHA